MIKTTQTEFKNNPVELFNIILKEPITITKHNSPTWVVISYDVYDSVKDFIHNAYKVKNDQ